MYSILFEPTTGLQRFIISIKKQGAMMKVIERTFSYPGPKPFSKETAIVMMADAVEAASKSLKNLPIEI